MKNLTFIIGVLLIALGIISLAYQGITYKTEKNILAIGNLQLTEEHQKTLPIPPLMGGVAIAAGIVLAVVAGIRKK